ncbi:hypothetical protein TWF106_001235 [Orbilia oligospora]|uniref:JmjC domain-containing protein n=1 Tax=Orbilia oligospora TaxID=2813651 RepID=A0A7C8QB54_ORBOL|nr:hypothetical protein TWF679_001100 [Orbilia oligospora]KAF3205114.1 hypothetical protein TWF106_001235 [Orbilia oligospora]
MAGTRTRKVDGAPATQPPERRAGKRSRKDPPGQPPQCEAEVGLEGQCAIPLNSGPIEATPAHKFIQRMTCQSLKKNGANIIQCQSCIERRNDSGGCRFAGFRAFKLLNPADDLVANVTPSEASKLDTNRPSKKRKLNGHPPLPPGLDYHNYALVGDRKRHAVAKQDENCLFSTSAPLGKSPKPLSDTDAYIMSKIAPALCKTLKRELQHEEQLKHPTIRIAEDPAQRSLCDSCATTLFIVSYVCHVCGREYCPDCYDDWTESGNIRFETCSRNKMHTKEQLLIAVRACEGELKAIVGEIQLFLDGSKHPERSQTGDPDRGSYPVRALQDDMFAPVFEFTAELFDEGAFKDIWSMHGRPIIIKDCLDRFNLPWDPEYFINNHGHEDCTLVQTCPPFKNYVTKVARFFEQFGKPHVTGTSNPKGAPSSSFTDETLKLKDWPPADNFADVFPDLMVDFELALPEAVAQHVKHNGVYNLASRFPDGYNKPDLGPKMYNAFPATVQMDGRIGGTTNLHRDITDAINFMMYATSVDDDFDAPGAIWDIFPIGATKIIREYLDKQFPGQPTDPFHRQNCYLSPEDLEILYIEHGVQSYRILQCPGDAVMIPAGCAHQVRNLKDCIKVAVDFLSPENAEICEYLLQENRAIAQRANSSVALATKKGKESKKMSRVKKEDVLQLWKCLMYYYEGVRGQLWAVDPEDLEKVEEDCTTKSDRLDMGNVADTVTPTAESTLSGGGENDEDVLDINPLETGSRKENKPDEIIVIT